MLILDKANAYHHIPLVEEDIPKTSFICEQGLFEYGTLPFGLTNAPKLLLTTDVHITEW